MRFGRFDASTYNNDHVSIRMDHANGDPCAYEFPHMSYAEAGDLIYALKRMRQQVRDWQDSQQRMMRAGIRS
jgi:hypothetical protein